MQIDISSGGGFVPHTELCEAFGAYTLQKAFVRLDTFGTFSWDNGYEMFTYKGKVYKTYPKEGVIVDPDVTPYWRRGIVGINFHFCKVEGV